MLPLAQRKQFRLATLAANLVSTADTEKAAATAFRVSETLGRDGTLHTAGDEAEANAASDLKAAGVTVDKDGVILEDRGNSLLARVMPAQKPRRVTGAGPESGNGGGTGGDFDAILSDLTARPLDPVTASAVAEGAPAAAVGTLTPPAPAQASPFPSPFPGAQASVGSVSDAAAQAQAGGTATPASPFGATSAPAPTGDSATAPAAAPAASRKR